MITHVARLLSLFAFVAVLRRTDDALCLAEPEPIERLLSDLARLNITTYRVLARFRATKNQRFDKGRAPLFVGDCDAAMANTDRAGETEAQEDHWTGFDAALHLLDDPERREAGLATLARHRDALSAKELLLKACESLSWYRGALGTAFVLECVELALQQSADSGTRTAQHADEALQAVMRCLCDDNNSDDDEDDDVMDEDAGDSGKSPRDLSVLYEPALRVVEVAARYVDERRKVCETLLRLVGRRGHDMGSAPMTKCARLLADK